VGKAPAGIFDLMRKSSARGIQVLESHEQQNVTLGPESLETFGTSSPQLEPVPLRVAAPRWSRASVPLA
jgi:hypothetical protein